MLAAVASITILELQEQNSVEHVRGLFDLTWMSLTKRSASPKGPPTSMGLTTRFSSPEFVSWARTVSASKMSFRRVFTEDSALPRGPIEEEGREEGGMKAPKTDSWKGWRGGVRRGVSEGTREC